MFALGLATGAIIATGHMVLVYYLGEKWFEKLEKKEGEK